MAAPRMFDHDEAVRLHAAGLSCGVIATKYGVTESAIWQAVKRATDPTWAEQNNAYSREWQRKAKRVPCSGCGEKLIWKNSSRSGMCPACVGLARRETATDGLLRCALCHEWKPDDQFPRSKGKPARRDRHSDCRPCQAKRRRDHRRRNREADRAYQRAYKRRKRAA